jgi:pimeloyl-ACP methyl ester carboxylesterase
MPLHNYNNLKLAYEAWGSGEIALLFIHGLGGNKSVWKYQVEFFAPKYRVIAVDLFGHGESDKEVNPTYVPRIDAEAILSLMKNEIRMPYIAVGHSFAGLVLGEMINIGDENLKGVAFVDCTYQGNDSVIERRAAFGNMMLAHGDDTIEPETENWYKGLIGPKASDADRQMILSSLGRCDLRWLFRSVAGCREYDLKYPQRKIPVRNNLPIFVMEADNGVGAEIRKSWVNHFKNAEYYLFEDAHHFFFIVQKDKFNALLDEFSGKAGGV